MHSPASRQFRLHAPFQALLTLGLLGACAQPTPAPPNVPPRVVATGLNGPQGVHVSADGAVWVTDDGQGGTNEFTVPGETGPQTATYGDTARLIRVAPDGTQNVVTTLFSVSLPEIGATGGGKIAVIGSTVYVADGAWNAGASIPRPARASSVLRVDGAAAVEVANLYAFEAANNPDGVPASDGGIDSHTYGLAAGPDGQLYVADAGANALLKVNPTSGQVSLVASLAGLTGTGAQSVPTGVAFGNDGSAYVSLLSGGPFPSGAARVVKITGSTASDFATGLTMLTDIEKGPDGQLYAVSFGSFAPAGPLLPPFAANAGSIIRLGPGGSKTTVLSGLNYPTSLAFNAAGDAYVAENGLGLPGSGRVVRYAGLTRYPAQ